MSRTPLQSPDSDPGAEYARRLEVRRAEAAGAAQLDRTLANWRGIVFLVGVALVVFAATQGAFQAGITGAAWIAPPAAVFLALVILHDRAIRQRRRAERAVRFYEQGLARLQDRWAGSGVTGERFRDPAHPYAVDLDLFGTGSLFELLCAARTQTGEETLAAWLLAPSAPNPVRGRQAAVCDLRERLDLREELALLGEDVRAGVDVKALVAWGAAPVLLSGTRLRGTAAVLALCTVVALAAWGAGLGPGPFFAVLVVAQGFALSLRRKVGQVVRSVDQPGRDLALISLLLQRFEREGFEAPLLRELRASLDTEGLPPSAQVARLERLIGLLDAQRNLLFAFVGTLLLWDTQFALAIEAWRAANGPRIARWLETVGQLEALCSFAGYAYEHPADTFPEILEEGARFEAEGLGHPLLPTRECVPNDLCLGDPVRLLIVSGSNMSGKSTLLRSVGVNTVLGLAGAPVRARSLRLTPLMTGAAIRVQDSLQQGMSLFYAEITRLRQIVDLSQGSPPLLFLFDEILHGTNSHDRRIGAAAVLRALVDAGALGLATTHDLALARIVDDLAPRAANVHFEDHLEAGKMTFDYRLRPGVVEKSNALELMRLVGLKV